MPTTAPKPIRPSERKLIMFRKIALTAVSALTISVVAANAAGEAHIHDTAFAHEGPFGKFDQFQLQRGLQVGANCFNRVGGVQGNGGHGNLTKGKRGRTACEKYARPC